MNSELTRRIERLEAESGIQALIARLARAFDHGPSRDGLLSVFAKDAVFQIDQYGVLTGAEAIADGVVSNSEAGFRWTLHFLVSPIITLNDDYKSGAVEFMLFEPATAGSGQAYWIGGRYTADVVYAGEAWRFQRLELSAELISRYSEGWRSKPDSLANA
jgi:hypothetical protein